MRMKKQHLKQRSDGRYACRHKDKWFMGLTEDEALAAREEYIDRLKHRELLESDGITVYTYAFKWLPVHKASVSTNTYNAYASYLNRLVKKLGTVPMKNVTPSDIKDFYNEYIGSSDSTIKKVKMLCSELWDSAIEDGVAKSNPCRSKTAKPHKGTEGSHRALSRQEDSWLFLSDDRLRPAVMLMRYAGLRRGEALALNIDRDVDFDNNLIHVRYAIHFEGNKPVIGPTKTDAGFRAIPLLSVLRDELCGLHGLAAPSYDGSCLTQTMWDVSWTRFLNNLRLKVNGCQHRWYGRTKAHIEMKKAGVLPAWQDISFRPHDLRHSYCTMLRDAGVDLKLAIQWMGHEDEKMILRIYDHVTDARVSITIRNVENALAEAAYDSAYQLPTISPEKDSKTPKFPGAAEDKKIPEALISLASG